VRLRRGELKSSLTQAPYASAGWRRTASR
jgi:hypothetical protein